MFCARTRYREMRFPRNMASPLLERHSQSKLTMFYRCCSLSWPHGFTFFQGNTPHCWSSNYCSSVTGQMGWVVHLNECLYCSIRVYSLFRYLNVSLFCGRVNITVCNPSLSSNSHYHQTLQASETFRPS